MAKAAKHGGLSLRTKDATEGGGTEGALATIETIEFVDEFTYGGTQKDKPSAALHVVFIIDGMARPWDQHYSVGPSDKYEVVADGDGIRSLGKGTGLNKKSPAYHFIESVETAAEKDKLDLDDLLPELDEGGNSVRPLEGRRVHLTNVKKETVGGDMKEYLVIAGFEDDEEKPARGGKTGGKAASSSKASAGDVEEKTIEAVKDLIEEHTSVKKSDLANLVYAANRKDADAKAMMQLCLKDAFIGDEERPWSFDRKKGVLRATA